MGKVPGVVNVKADAKKKQAVLEIDSSKFVAKAALEALKAAGYKKASVDKG